MSSDSSVKLSYPAFTRKLFYISLLFCVLALLFIYRIHLHEYQNMESHNVLFKFFLSASIPMGILLRLLFVIRPRIYKIWELDGHSLFIGKGKSKIEVHFSQIKQVQPSFLPPRFLGGFYLNLNDGRKIFISSLIQGSDKILEKACAYDKNLIQPDRLRYLKRSIVSAGKYWARVAQRGKSPGFLLIKFLCLPLLASYYSIYNNSPSFQFYDTILVFLFPVFFFLNFLVSFLISIFLDQLILKFESKKDIDLQLQKVKTMQYTGELLSLLVLLLIAGAVNFSKILI